MDNDTVTVTVTFSRRGVAPRRVDWVTDRLRAEVVSAVAFVVNAHPDIRFDVDGEEQLPDLKASEADVLAAAALQGGAADGRTTEEIAAAAYLPRARVHQQLSHPKSGLVLGPDGRWWPKGSG